MGTPKERVLTSFYTGLDMNCCLVLLYICVSLYIYFQRRENVLASTRPDLPRSLSPRVCRKAAKHGTRATKSMGR